MAELAHLRATLALSTLRIKRVYRLGQDASVYPAELTPFKVAYERVGLYYSEFEQTHDQIIQHLTALPDAAQAVDAEINALLVMDDIYLSIKSMYCDLVPAQQIDAPAHAPGNNIQLPKISLPTFDGNLKAWPTFNDLFRTLIHDNTRLSEIEKFQYLVMSLTQEPLKLVRALPLTAANYLIAYDTLTRRYQNKRLLATSCWDAIYNFAPIVGETANGLRSLVDTFSENISSLTMLGFPTDSWDFVLFNLMLQRLPNPARARFERQCSDIEIPTFEQLKDFIRKEAQALESVEINSVVTTKSNKPAQPKNSFPRTSSFFVETDSDGCVLCKSNHLLHKCSLFLKMDPNARFSTLKQHKLCINCLKPSHRATNCPSTFSCKTCASKHHSLLHFKERESTASPKQPASPSPFSLGGASPSGGSGVNVLTGAVVPKSTVLLSTALVEILDSRGDYQTLRALLDSGSQASFIAEKSFNRLGLRRSKLTLPISCLGGGSSTSNGYTTCSIRCEHTKPNIVFEAFVLPTICADMPSTSLSAQNWDHIQNLKLADPTFNKPGHIDMLLGADIVPLIMCNGRLSGNNDAPIALNTVFGWVLMGKVQSTSRRAISSLHSSIDTSLEESLTKFWTLEEIPGKTILSSEEKECESSFVSSHIREASGRFVVSLPFKQTEPTFTNTRSLALRRFYSLERRLNQTPSIAESYKEFMRDYLTASHMEQVSPPVTDVGTHYYIPHHCILRPDSATTKLRVVFDASAKDACGISLNATLSIGPTLQKDIATILLNFRLHFVVFTADIKQMYRQILVNTAHRDYQRIIWRFSPDEPIQDFRLNTVTYGVSSAPYLALRTVQQLAADGQSRWPRAATAMQTDVYMDDVVTGGKNIDEAVSLAHQLVDLCREGGFELRKWASNHPELLASVNPPCELDSMSFDADKNSVLKILGLHWNPSRDLFFYKITSIDSVCTKRTILSELARIFDPLGFLAPLTFFAKHLIQQLWSLGLSWDATPPSEIATQWAQYKLELPNVSQINVRRYLSCDREKTCELHGFCDASEKGYAAVIYLRVIGSDTSFATSLICAKSKVAPLKRISIPRLELCAALLLAQLMEFVNNLYASRLSSPKIYAWSDSSVALSWIKSSPHRWKTFVANRVTAIQEKISPTFWHHVSSRDNPADCASRGLLPSELVAHPLWWAGPAWLCTPRHNWPASRIAFAEPSSLALGEEERRVTLTATISVDSIKTLLDRYSSLAKIIRIVVYISRFIHNSQFTETKRTGHIVASETQAALMLLVKQVQHEVFSDEIDTLNKGRMCSKVLRKLNPFIDKMGILRVGGRLSNTALQYDVKHPALLPREHRLTTLIIEHVHSKNMHPGLRTMQFLLSQQFWILSPRRAIRHCLAKCYKCFRINPTSLQPKMGELPSFRVSQAKPFECVGIDYGGPFHITLGKRRGSKSEKAYLCLFVCLATKAIHLELASSLSAEAFLAALRRFIGRRGRCARIHSDNGTNFVGGHKYIMECMKNAAEAESIEWQFNPPSAPHFGGVWEAGIKSAKTHLSRVIGEQILTYEELLTVLVQIEAVLNSRPLCALSSDPNDLAVLTPGHFLTLEPLTALPDPDLTSVPLNRLDRWQLLQRLHQDFWKRWHTEYLHTLQQRNKWQSESPSAITTGSLVVIKNELQPPLRWLLGRVISTHAGRDGVCRVVTLRTATGLLKRPVVKLCPLPVQ